VNHGSDTDPPYQPVDRESGALVAIDDDGDELRVHSDECGRWHARRWRVNMGRWIGPEAAVGSKALTAEEWRACAGAIREETR